MINYQIKKYLDNGEERFLQIEIVTNEFNNTIIDIDGDYEELFNIYILLNSNNNDKIQEFLIDECQVDDIPTIAQLSQRGEI